MRVLVALLLLTGCARPPHPYSITITSHAAPGCGRACREDGACVETCVRLRERDEFAIR